MTKNTLNFIYGFILLMLGIFVFFLINDSKSQNAWQITGNVLKGFFCCAFVVLGLIRMNDSTRE